MNIYSQIAANKRKSWLILSFFSGLIVGLGWLFSQTLRSGPELFILATVLAFFTSGLTYFFSDRLALGLSAAKPIRKRDEPRLFRIVENLCIGSGLVPPPKIYLIEDQAINAFATGRDPKHAAVAVTRGALSKLDDLELEGVVAHELAHIRNYDTRTMTVAVVLVGLISLVAEFFLRVQAVDDRQERRGHSGLVPLFAFLGALLASILANLLKLALSRQREFLADASAALLTRYPDGLANALEKIAEDTTPLAQANPATAHLFISNPLKQDAQLGRRLNRLFSTHPPIHERIQRLRAM